MSDLGVDSVIKGFSGEHRWLSNFHPVTIRNQGFSFHSVENAYQAAKCANCEDVWQFVSLTPGQSKRLGRRVEIRSDWDDMREAVMLRLLRRKFEWPLLSDALCDTEGSEIVEWNTWGDKFWGVTNEGGDNRLGKLLMQVRTERLNMSVNRDE